MSVVLAPFHAADVVQVNADPAAELSSL